MNKEAAAAGSENLGNCLSEFLDNGSIESHRYYLARRTMLEMLKDRGYAVPNSDIGVSLQEFRNKHGPNPDIDSLKILALHKDDAKIKVLVLFSEPSIIKMNSVRGLAAFITNRESIADLLINITKHDLKPKHQVLTNEEKENLLKKYRINEKQLPRMSQKDAIARYYGLEKGQVVKVAYSGELTQLHVTYRCVW